MHCRRIVKGPVVLMGRSYGLLSISKLIVVYEFREILSDQHHLDVIFMSLTLVPLQHVTIIIPLQHASTYYWPW
jgi:hypothetical protein